MGRDGVTTVQIINRVHAELSSDTDRPGSRERDRPGRVKSDVPHAAAHDATVVVLKLPRRHRRITPVRRASP